MVNITGCYFESGRMYKTMTTEAEGVHGEVETEVLKGTEEYERVYAFLEAHPELWNELNWEGR
jgi:hypothetical protein